MERQPARQKWSPWSVRSLVAAHSAGAARGAAGSFAHGAFVRSVHGLRVPCVRSIWPKDWSGENPVRNALIGGIGNVLLGDDGVGPYVLRILESMYSFEEGIELA